MKKQNNNQEDAQTNVYETIYIELVYIEVIVFIKKNNNKTERTEVSTGRQSSFRKSDHL